MLHNSELKTLLCNGVGAMQLQVTEQQLQSMLQYLELLAKWNQAYNLSAIRELPKMVIYHLLDSLSLLPHIMDVTHILDVGTGAGLPGIPLAITKPEQQLTLVDSQQKKINFVQHVITSLGLQNARAFKTRIEDLGREQVVDADGRLLIVSRAFASLGEFVNLIRNVCDERSLIIAMKGKDSQVDSEIALLPQDFKVRKIHKAVVPGIDGQRCLVILEKT